MRHFRARVTEVARRAANGSADSRDVVWAEAAGPGSYRWLWTRAVKRAPTVLGLVALAVCLSGIVGWVFDLPWLAGEVLTSPSFPLTSAILLGMLATAMMMLRPDASPVQVRAGRLLAATVLAVGGVLLILHPLDVLPIDWGTGSLRDPALAAIVNMSVLALALVTVDSDAPRYLWQKWLAPLIGILLVTSVVTKGYQTLLFAEGPADFSFSGSIAVTSIYWGYLFLRPDRGLAAFMTATGPGPSMARLLVPPAVLVPAAMVGADLIAERLEPTEAAFLRGLDKMLMLILLLWMIVYASRRLQRFYENWQEANIELTSQADVLTRMSEGVVVARISDSRIVLTNPQFDAMHGYRTNELVGRHIDVIAPRGLSDEELAMRSRVLHELAEKGESSYENRSMRKDGSNLWTRANSVVTTVPDHGPVLIVVKYDISEEHRAKHAGRDAEMRFQQVFEQSPIGLCLVTSEGRFEKVNRSFEQVTGYSANELTSMTFAEITHPEDLEEDLALSGEMFAGKRDGFSMEKRYIRKNGEVVWVFLTVVMLRDQEGVPSQALSMVEDITERHRLSQQLQYLADHDPLTGLYNRRRFEEELSSAISSGHGRGIAILVIDLDNFKFVNDSHGHSVGDRLIVRTSELLRSSLRSEDVLARQGGDEFVVVMRDIEPADAVATAEELVRIVGTDARVEGTGHLAKVTASIGVAVASDAQPVPEETLMMQADIAMYEAKDSGRNGVRLFHPGEDSHVTLGIDWAGRLRGALENDDLLIYAQPILQLGELDRPHFELFIRMRDSDGGIIRPGAFLPTAERHDLIQEVDHWVIEKALETLAKIDADVCPRFSVNLSGRTVGDARLPDFVQDQLDRTGVDPANLIFEVTETSAISNMARAQEFSKRINDLGCGFALDDFGTGFASFFYLKHMAFDYVKIDGEFVQNLASDPVNRLLVRALVQISQGMGKLTVAEQVEDIQTVEVLREYGVNFVQGYFIGRPRPLERIDLTALPDTSLGTTISG